jgi:ectoine hydroxylase-related dioxygenase (phytanoyl-CoA dioxygenase family)
MDLSEPIAAIMVDERIVAIATACVGRPVVVLKDKLILKPPGATGYVMHQDAAYFPVDDPAVGAVALVVALDASGPDNGGLLIVPGAHHTLLSPPNVPTDLDPDDLAPPDAVELAPGDVLAMSVLAPHGSDTNVSGGSRRHLYLTYAPDEGTDQRSAYYEAQHRRLREQLPPERRALAHFR